MPVLTVGGYHPAPDVESINSKFGQKLLYVKRSTNLRWLYGDTCTIKRSQKNTNDKIMDKTTYTQWKFNIISNIQGIT